MSQSESIEEMFPTMDFIPPPPEFNLSVLQQQPQLPHSVNVEALIDRFALWKKHLVWGKPQENYGNDDKKWFRYFRRRDDYELKMLFLKKTRVVVVAQLVERSLPTPKNLVLNTCIGKFLLTVSCIEKTKMKE